MPAVSVVPMLRCGAFLHALRRTPRKRGFGDDGALGVTRARCAHGARLVGQVHSFRTPETDPHGVDRRVVGLGPTICTCSCRSLDRSIRIWSIATGAPVAVLCTSDSWVSSLAIAADASTLYSAHGDGRITVWGAETEPPSLSRPSTRHADAAVTSFGFTILRTLTDFWAAGVSQVLFVRCPVQWNGGQGREVPMSVPHNPHLFWHVHV